MGKANDRTIVEFNKKMAGWTIDKITKPPIMSGRLTFHLSKGTDKKILTLYMNDSHIWTRGHKDGL